MTKDCKWKLARKGSIAAIASVDAENHTHGLLKANSIAKGNWVTFEPYSSIESDAIFEEESGPFTLSVKVLSERRRYTLKTCACAVLFLVRMMKLVRQIRDLQDGRFERGFVVLDSPNTVDALRIRTDISVSGNHTISFRYRSLVGKSCSLNLNTFV